MKRLALALAGAVLLTAAAPSFTPLPHLGIGVADAASAAARKKLRKAPRKAVRQPPPPPREPVRVDPEARKKNEAKRRSSGTPPPPYGGTAVRPRIDNWDFGPGTVLPRTDQLKPRQPRPPLLHPPRPPRGWEPVPGPGQGPGTYITPIYPGTIGPTGN